jgi:hypothetical protein
MGIQVARAKLYHKTVQDELNSVNAWVKMIDLAADFCI